MERAMKFLIVWTAGILFSVLIWGLVLNLIGYALLWLLNG
jgi:hypothetical protein